MGNYNPYKPHILGEEWVPIRNEPVQLSPLVNTVELGHQFTTASSNILSTGRFYVREMSPGTQDPFMLSAIYVAGSADQTGPLSRVIIPVDSVATSGAVNAVGGAANGATALLTPKADYYYAASTASGAGPVGNIWISYNTAPYNTLLNGKRIVAVNLLFGASSTLAVNSEESDNLTPFVCITTSSNDNVAVRGVFAGAFNNISRVAFDGNLTRFHLGNVCFTSNVALNSAEFLPWTFEDINRFDAGHSSRIYAAISAGTLYGDPFPGDYVLWYSGLEVIYCEEKRLIVGGWQCRTVNDFMNYGANVANMRTWPAKANFPTLAAGSYTVTLSTMSYGDQGTIDPIDIGPDLYATRELYSLPPQIGIQVNVPYPPEDNIGEVFTVEQTDILTMISLHTSGAPLTEVHAYGSNLAAQIYGTNTATQILTDTGVTAASFPWVRFYARRFGDTTIPLTITGVGGLSGSTAAISVAEFDALDELVDGWKEITLRFSAAPTMGGVTPSWTWSAATETAGNRWELLGAAAPGISGLPGNLFGQVVSNHQLSSATYNPPAGAAANLTWMPQGVATPYVSGATSDASSDAVVLFAQDAPTVSGFTVNVTSQAVTGIGTDCGLNPCSIPSAISYNQLAWTQLSGAGMVPTSGFGYYEIQRSDTITDWATIMAGTAITGTSFKDYEARVGILTSYRIRAVDLYGFYGLWSSTVTATIPAPGVTAGCITGGHVMIFTSNESQIGRYNLAYSNAWEGKVEEAFTFPEAGFTQLQAMYDRDFAVAFRPTERGGVAFQRTILVQAAAISPETLEDFVSLRSMAWADTSYICVRDEDGNRWFATIGVPDGRVRLYRSIYTATVNIVEVTDTPSPVNPWS